MQENVVSLANYRYFKWALWLCVAALIAYIWHTPVVTANGGTWLGYTLGSIGALLILWLLSFGIRKRSYRANLGDLRYWLSAHIWLGIALVLIATLHAGFQFGWNVHTLAYALTVLVVVSGVWGVVMYLRHPGLMSGLLDGKTLVQRGEELSELDSQAEQRLASDDARHQQQVYAPLLKAAAAEAIAPGFFNRLRANPAHSATRKAVDEFENRSLTGDPLSRELALLMVKRDHMLGRIRRFVRLKTLTEFWLLIHVPASIALLASLVAHVVSVFFYW